MSLLIIYESSPPHTCFPKIGFKALKCHNLVKIPVRNFVFVVFIAMHLTFDEKSETDDGVKIHKSGLIFEENTF